MSDVLHRLSSPSRRLSFEELADAWFAARISVRLRGYAPLALDAEGDPVDGTAAVLDLLHRLRGAVGQVLIESASPEAIAGRPCPWMPPCAFDILFREQARAGAYGIPKPWVLAAEPHGRDLVVSMTIFGLAADWSAAAEHALVAALQHRIDWRAVRPRLFLPRLDLAAVTLRAIEGVPVPAARGVVEIRFVTPMNAEGDDPLERPATVLARLAHRLRGLAQWHDASIAADWALLERLRGDLQYDTALLQRRRLRRRSGRQRQVYRAETVEGVLRIADVPRELRAMLAVGRLTHVGKGASEGFGRYLVT